MASKDRALHEATARVATLEAALAGSQAALADERGKRARIASGRLIGSAADTVATRNAAAHKAEARRLQEGVREHQRALEAVRGRLARASAHERALQQQLQVFLHHPLPALSL